MPTTVTRSRAWTGTALARSSCPQAPSARAAARVPKANTFWGVFTLGFPPLIACGTEPRREDEQGRVGAWIKILGGKSARCPHRHARAFAPATLPLFSCHHSLAVYRTSGSRVRRSERRESSPGQTAHARRKTEIDAEFLARSKAFMKR